RAAAAAWLARHPEAAATALVPAALGRPGPARRQAEQALRQIAAAGHGGAVTAAASAHGAPAAAGVAALLAADPLDELPTRVPALPTWLDPALFPSVRWRDRSGAMPREAVRHL